MARSDFGRIFRRERKPDGPSPPGTKTVYFRGYYVRVRVGDVEVTCKGGNTVKSKHGADHYLRIGQKGGTAVKDKYGPDYYSAIGKKRWEGRTKKTDSPE